MACQSEIQGLADSGKQATTTVDYSQSDSIIEMAGRTFPPVSVAGSVAASAQSSTGPGILSGVPVKHRSLSIDFLGPDVCEYWSGDWGSSQPNPFLHGRFLGVFEHEATGFTLVVPGFFAADGNAADTSAECGPVWRINFLPILTGTWNYGLSFQGGQDLAVNISNLGSSIPPLDGASGSFFVQDMPNDDDPRNKGPVYKLRNQRYLKYFEKDDMGNDQYFLANGADSPENMLGYFEFDDTNSLNPNIKLIQNNYVQPTTITDDLHHWEWHAADYDSRDDDLLWAGGKGKNFFGMINYLDSVGINSIYFVTFSFAADSNDTWPQLYNSSTSDIEYYQFDVSKLDQWGRALEGVNRRGFMLHMVTKETENDAFFGFASGPNPEDLPLAAKVYYRELIARFGHFLNLRINLGEEYSVQSIWTDADYNIPATTAYIETQAYTEPTTSLHTYPNQYGLYDAIIVGPGSSTIDSASFQLGESWGGDDLNGEEVYDLTRTYLAESNCQGALGGCHDPAPWAMFMDEIPGAMEQTFPGDAVGFNNHALVKSIWANLSAGGSGGEYYFGYDFSATPTNPWHGDVDAEDMRSRHETFVLLKHATQFFQDNLPFADMQPVDGLSSDPLNYVYHQAGEVYMVFSPRGYTFNLDLTAEAGVTFLLRIFDPKTGLFEPGTTQVNGGGLVPISFSTSGGYSHYWVALLERL